ncbi:MAG TPA: prephenate dehydratase [Kribbella sp.]|nr:prephenate dehydratase [Kribbella sp.]
MPGVPPARYAYLGPVGTFTEAALRTVPAAQRAELEPYPTVGAALDAVRAGDVDGALVPIENSVEGSVPVTLDELAVGEPVTITREVLLRVRFDLLAKPGTTLADVKRVISHPHAEAQCRGWLRRHLPDAVISRSASTAAAAVEVAQGDAAHDAAIAAPVAGEHYRLVSLAADIGDNPHAMTRFVLVSRPGPPTVRTGADKTSLVAFIRDDHPGALMEILDEFAVRGVNLTRLESRPTGEAMGRYCFSLDAEGHIADKRVGEALMGLRRVCAEVRFLGSYPRADQTAATVRRGTTDADFLDAERWLARLRDGRI